MFLQKDTKQNGYVPVLKKKDDDLPEFVLNDGNLTSADKSVAAIYGAIPKIFPPPLFPLIFTSEASGKDGAEVVFVTKTRSDGSGREIRRLFFLNGRKLMSRTSRLPYDDEEEGEEDGAMNKADTDLDCQQRLL